MPRKQPRKRIYDIPFVGIDIKPLKLNERDLDVLARILGKRPSPEFQTAYKFVVGTFHAHRSTVRDATAAAIGKRFTAVATAANALCHRIEELNLTDRTFYADYVWQKLSPSEQEAIPELRRSLGECIQMCESAVLLLKDQPKRGRMPASAEHAVAISLCQILFEETKTVPKTTKGGTFDRLLSRALSHDASSKPRRDVKDLLRVGLKRLSKTPFLLPLFKVRDHNLTVAEFGELIGLK